MIDLTFLPETNWVDIVVVIFLIRGGYIGLARGFSMELFQTLAAIATTVLSLFYYGMIAEWLVAHSFLSLQAANPISFLALVFSLLIVFKIVRILLFGILHLELFGGLERWGGFALGLARSFIFASLFLFVLTLFPLNYFREAIEEKSFSGAYIKGVAPGIFNFVVQFTPKAKEN